MIVSKSTISVSFCIVLALIVKLIFADRKSGNVSITIIKEEEDEMKIMKERFFDMPMVITLLALCCIMLFIFHADRNKMKETEMTVIQRDTVETVKPDSYSLTFFE